jgi:tetratricopeptide (TPR) repeat protein
MEQSFRKIADQVKVRGRKDPQADVFRLVYEWLANEKNGPWLLVLDNVDDAASLDDDSKSSNVDAPQQRLSRYLPPSRHGSVLVTSRTKREVMQVVEDRDIISVEPMHHAASYALLRKKLQGLREEDDSISQLAALLDHMPLALVQAAAYIQERAPRCSVRQYLEEFCQSDKRKTSLLNHQAGHLRRDREASNSILLTWQISFNHIQNIRPSAADKLSLMSFFDRHGIQEALLRVSTSQTDDKFEDDILALRDYSLITPTQTANTFEMHSLVQLATRTWLENEGQLVKWQEQFISNLSAELPIGEHKDWEKYQSLFPHAQAAVTQRPQSKELLEKWALLLYKAACYAWQRGLVDETEHMSTMSMEARIEVLGEKDPETLNSMEMVGIGRVLQGKYEAAELINRQTLLWREEVLGDDHPATLTIMTNLATVLDSQGKFAEAELLNRQTLLRSEKILGRDHPDTLISMSNLATVLASQAKYDVAEELNRQTLFRSETILGREHPSTLRSMSNLAHTLSRLNKYEEAETIGRQTLAQKEKVLGPNHPSTLISMSNLATVLDSQGKYTEAETMYRQSLSQREVVLGHNHLSTLSSVSCLAHLLASRQRYNESFALYEKACAGYEAVLGKDHLTTRTCRQLYADALASVGSVCFVSKDIR